MKFFIGFTDEIDYRTEFEFEPDSLEEVFTEEEVIKIFNILKESIWEHQERQRT